MTNIEKELQTLKDYFRNKAACGSVLLNGEDVLLAFEKVVTSIEVPRHVWIEHNGLGVPVFPSSFFGAVKFRDGSTFFCNLADVPRYQWIHTDKPDNMVGGSIKRREKWNNQIMAYMVQE